MNHRNDNPPRSPNGLLRGGHTRSVYARRCGAKMDAASATNALQELMPRATPSG